MYVFMYVCIRRPPKLNHLRQEVIKCVVELNSTYVNRCAAISYYLEGLTLLFILSVLLLLLLLLLLLYCVFMLHARIVQSILRSVSIMFHV